MEFMQTCKPVSSKLTWLPSPGIFVKMEKLDVAPTLLARLQILLGFHVCPSVPVCVSGSLQRYHCFREVSLSLCKVIRSPCVGALSPGMQQEAEPLALTELPVPRPRKHLEPRISYWCY